MRQISPEKLPIPPHRQAGQNLVQRYAPWLYAFWKFSRPHTIIGTSLSALGLYAIALSTTALGELSISSLFQILLPAWFACICGNVYIVGLNQLEDVGIDRINKPHLPLASGEFARWEAQGIVVTTGLLALLVALLQGPYLLAMVGISLALGTAYSLPPLRLKRFPLWASFCIFTVRGVIVNVGLFLHFNQQFQGVNGIPAPVWTLTAFILIFTFAIAIFKDIPDMEGDRRYNISTFTIRAGARAVFNLSRWVITLCYVGMIAAAPVLPTVNAPFLITTHLAALGILWMRSRTVNLEDRSSIARFYQFIWKLFFLEYLMFPIACLLFNVNSIAPL
ncbi:MAG TPA: homogentisate phytyltransferase [Crinalium sp.]|jgi:homogentisate phytyltransferase/homogentisate geranylgeranyltransferase